MNYQTKSEIVEVRLVLTDREANDLYSDVYRMQRDLPGARKDYPLIFAVYDTLDRAGVDGTR